MSPAVCHRAVVDLVVKHVPLRYGQDRVFVSADAAEHLIRPGSASGFSDVIDIDPGLSGLEMRLERWDRFHYHTEINTDDEPQRAHEAGAGPEATSGRVWYLGRRS